MASPESLCLGQPHPDPEGNGKMGSALYSMEGQSWVKKLPTLPHPSSLAPGRTEKDQGWGNVLAGGLAALPQG